MNETKHLRNLMESVDSLYNQKELRSMAVASVDKMKLDPDSNVSAYLYQATADENPEEIADVLRDYGVEEILIPYAIKHLLDDEEIEEAQALARPEFGKMDELLSGIISELGMLQNHNREYPDEGDSYNILKGILKRHLTDLS